MNDNLSAVALVVDRSGSMGGVRSDTIGGINTFFDTQRQEMGDSEVRVTVTQFNTMVETTHDWVNLKDMDKFTESDFVPSGCTALRDAIGTTIDNLGHRLAKMKEEDRPSKVIIAILTDGYENSSREYSLEKINEMVSRQEKDYNWDIMFLGAGLDALQVAGTLGITSDHAMHYSTKSMGNAFTAMASSTCRGLKGMSTSYTSAERSMNTEPEITTTTTTTSKLKIKMPTKRKKTIKKG
jgi:uncharacterized protein YegL